ncbi:hypothetical protein ELI07_03630 [Rhizobium leguminosarum]|nr:hypothetical protein ELI40_03775 [Rhizobium leguminosarum]TAX08662.1 hypothetical protein ELI07_03630 [Rhizobium leguminosarum]TAY10926.1 hypothetical protein ELH96_03730 [Rhizobium leguminosarum]
MIGGFAPHPNPLPVLTGRGDVPRERWKGTERSRHGPFAPRAGRRWRQPDEGLISTISRAKGWLDALARMAFPHGEAFEGPNQCAFVFSSPSWPPSSPGFPPARR